MDNYYMESGNFVSVHFPSVADLVDYTPQWNKSKYDEFIGNGAYGNIKAKAESYGPTANYKSDLKKFALLGDHDLYNNHLLPKVSDLRKQTGRLSKDYVQKIKASKRKRVTRSHGDEIDIHKVYQGQLDTAWSSTIREQVDQQTKYVTLFVMINGNSMRSAVDSLWRAAATLLLVEDLTKAGKMVQVIVGGPSRGVTTHGHDMCVSITVKKFNEQLSFERLAAMSHLGFYRTFCFAAKQCQPYHTVSTLGYSVPMSDNLIPLQFKDQVDSGAMKFIVVSASLSWQEAVVDLNKISTEFDGSSK